MDTLRQSTNRAADTPEGRLQATFERMDRELAMCVGHRLFTILLVQEDRQSLVRAYSSRPDAYPAGGKKKARWLALGRVSAEATPAISRADGRRYPVGISRPRTAGLFRV